MVATHFQPGLGYRLDPAAGLVEFVLDLNLTKTLIVAINLALRSGAGDVALLAELQCRAVEDLGPIVQGFITRPSSTA